MALPRSETGPADRQRALTDFFKTIAGANAVEISRIGRLAGGAIQQNWGIDVSFDGGSLTGAQRLVLRCDAATGVPSSLDRLEEFAVLRAVFAAGAKVPEPLFACADQGVLGKPFFVMRRFAGTAAGRPLTLDPALEPARPALAEAMGRELACIQTVRPPRADLDFLPRYDGPAAALGGLRAYLDRHPNPRPVLEWALRWAETHLPEPLPMVLRHGDFRTGNYLVEGTRLTAILDWEFAGWGDPDEDIGWFCCKGWRFGRLDREAGGIADRGDFYRGYESESGRRLDPERIRFWEVYANIRWAVIAMQQSDRFLVGGTRSLSTAITGRRATECELELLMLLDGGNQPAKPGAACGGGGRLHPPLRDLPGSLDLLGLARELLLDELTPLLPPDRQRDAHLIATTMAIAAREARAGDAWQREITDMLAALYDDATPTPTLPRLRGSERQTFVAASRSPANGGGSGWGLSKGNDSHHLLRRFATDLRNGAFETSPSREVSARAILWRLTIAKLREGNPHFLAANGFREAGGQGT